MDENLFWCIIGVIGGAIVSYFISYFFYFKSIKKKRLTYDIKTFCLVSDKVNNIEGLELKYNSVEIEDLYSSTITITNIGNSIIEEQDIVSSCPISISTSGHFLKAKHDSINSYPKNKVTEYILSYNENSDVCNYVEFNFDYIPQNAIISFSVFYIGDINFNGALKDGEIISPDAYEKKLDLKLKLFIIYSILCYPIAIFIGLLFTRLIIAVFQYLFG